MTKKLLGKIALVTGGSSGIGLASAKALVEAGAFVFITGRNQTTLDAAAKQIGNNCAGIRADVTNLDDLDNLYKVIQQEVDHLDILFANAGISEMRPLSEVTETHYSEIFDCNVKGVLFTVQKALPLLANRASIILAGSTTGTKGTGSFSVYSASKAAVRNFARSWIIDLKGKGIRVNTISPGPVDTPGLANLAPTKQSQIGMLSFLANAVPMGRIADSSEIANVIVFLASDEASFINGAEIFVDGGIAQI